MSRAIGMLETYGLVAAVEGLDAAIKSANVSVRSFEYVSGGLIAWFVEGEVGAVRVAVAAGKAAASRVGDVVSDHVIARVADGVGETLPPPRRPGGRKGGTGIHRRDFPAVSKSNEKAQPLPAAAKEKEVPEKAPTEEKKSEGKKPEEKKPVPAAPVTGPAENSFSSVRYGADELKALGVYDLRAIARQTEGLGLSRIEIRDARKNVLMKAILDAQDKARG